MSWFKFIHRREKIWDSLRLCEGGGGRWGDSRQHSDRVNPLLGSVVDDTDGMVENEI